MNEIQKNGYVKWFSLLTILIPLILVSFGYTYSVSNDSINRNEFNQFEKRFVDKFDSVEKRFDSLEKRFDSLELVLREIKIEIQELKNSGRKSD